MKTRLQKFFIFFLFFPLISVADEKFKVKIAVVDVESIFEHSFAIQNIRKSITEISENLQTEMSRKELELKQIEAELIKQRGVLSKQEFDKRILEFNKKVDETQQIMQRKKVALEQAHAEAIAKVHKTTIDIIGEMAEKQGFNLVLPSAQVLFVRNELNITLEVISSLNEALKQVEVIVP